jgi:hypothetical protein
MAEDEKNEEPEQKEEAPPMDTEAAEMEEGSGGADRPLMVSVLLFVASGLWMATIVV